MKYIKILIYMSMVFLFGTLLLNADYTQWNTSGWSCLEEDDCTVLMGNKNSTMNVLYSSGSVKNNCLSFDVQMTDSYGTLDGCIGAAYKCTNGFQYFFEYNTVVKRARIRRLGDGSSDILVGKEKDIELEVGTWYNFKIVFAESLVALYINGEEVSKGTDTFGDPFSGGSCYIQGYYATPKLKNIEFDDLKIKETEKTVIDLEFSSEAAVNSFTAKNASLSYKDGKLVCSIQGEGSYITSPHIAAKQGTKYSALLSVRNTIFVRLKNSTDADTIRVYYITSNDGTYNEAKSKLFKMSPNSGFESLFFNFSDSKGAKGYLTGFRLEPVGVNEGTLEIDAVTFEREKAFYDYAGSIISCIADGENVSIKGSVTEKYSGKTVELYEIDVTNYEENIKGLTKVATVKAQDTSFEFIIDMYNDNVSRLSSLFIAVTDGVKISDRFTISNYRDFQENPYEFKLPDYSVTVTDVPYGAKGDSFTDDTNAIQSAIDHVSKQGGGRVIVPGDDSYYGRRYIATNIKLKDNVELYIEEGAMIWQSQRMSDYKYDVAIGHDYPIAGVNWTHAASCHNYPLIQGDNVKNVKVSGGGTLRCCDTGSENLDSVGSTIWIGCDYRIHIIPIGFYKCENVEISDIFLKRTNNYHINMRTCRNVAVRNVMMNEVTCASGDGISATVGTKNMLIDRCFFYSNDDAVTICSTYNDPRGLAWWHAQPGEDNCIDNLTVVHSNLHGGHGITFITWGTDAPDLSMQEIKNIYVTDCVLGGGSCSVGAWPDNPYYGGAFDNSETNDYSPVKNVTIVKNRYKSATTIECIKATNFISDCGIRSAQNFENGDFERKNGQKGWISGLSNWSYMNESEDSVREVTERKNGHECMLEGRQVFYQGLYMSAGEHTFSMDVKVSSGKAQLVIYDAEKDTKLAFFDISSSGTATLSFNNKRGKLLKLGIELCSDDAKIYIDNASVTTALVEYRQYFYNDFSNESELGLNIQGWILSEEYVNNRLSTPSGRTGLNTLIMDYNYSDFDIALSVRVNEVLSKADSNFGLSLRRKDSSNQLSIEFTGTYLMVRKFQDGNSIIIKKTDGLVLEIGRWYTVGVHIKGSEFMLYLDGKLIGTYTEPGSVTEGKLLIAAYNTDVSIDNLTVAEAGKINMSNVFDIPSDEICTQEPDSADISAKGSITKKSGYKSHLPLMILIALAFVLSATAIVFVVKLNTKKKT